MQEETTAGAVVADLSRSLKQNTPRKPADRFTYFAPYSTAGNTLAMSLGLFFSKALQYYARLY